MRINDEHLTQGDQMKWLPDYDTVHQVLDRLAEGRENPSPLELAVLGTLARADGSLSVREITEALAADYDRPPTAESVFRVNIGRV
jgi:hypothetical protein